jgi:hypothetical protein
MPLRLKLLLGVALVALAMLAASASSDARGVRCTRIGNLRWCYAAAKQVEKLPGADAAPEVPGDFPGRPNCNKLEAIPGLLTVSCESS